MNELDLNEEEEFAIDQAWEELSSRWRQEGNNVQMKDQTTDADRRVSHLNQKPLDHEESVLLLSLTYQARAEGRDQDVPTLLGYYDNPEAFRKVLWDASRRGRNA